MGFPRIVVARMLMNTAFDLVVGAIPFLGDAFDLWFSRTRATSGWLSNGSSGQTARRAANGWRF